MTAMGQYFVERKMTHTYSFETNLVIPSICNWLKILSEELLV